MGSRVVRSRVVARADKPVLWLRAQVGVTALAVAGADCYAQRVFGIGYLELMVVGLLIILLFPPRELPKLARSAARAYGQVRRIADEFHRTVMLDDELREPLDEIRGAYDEARWDIRRAGQRVKSELRSAADEAKSVTKSVKPAAASKAVAPAPSGAQDPADDLDDAITHDPSQHAGEDDPLDHADHLDHENFEQDAPRHAAQVRSEGWESSELPPVNPAEPMSEGWESSELPPVNPAEPMGEGSDSREHPAEPRRPLVQPDHPDLAGRVAAQDPSRPAPSAPSPRPRVQPDLAGRVAAQDPSGPAPSPAPPADSSAAQPQEGRRLPMPASLVEPNEQPAPSPPPKGATPA